MSMRLTCKRCYSEGKTEPMVGCEGCASRLSVFNYRLTEEYRIVRRVQRNKTLPEAAKNGILAALQKRKKLKAKKDPSKQPQIDQILKWILEIEKGQKMPP